MKTSIKKGHKVTFTKRGENKKRSGTVKSIYKCKGWNFFLIEHQGGELCSKKVGSPDVKKK